ncbi:hypothetical protein DFH11DRAFT_1630283 [Phellopilus nigrolimitatus]|nr:hypothetical protein DFH11DRAFT_1630283 [Phellopilus nigrolimitatus]
MAKKSLGSLWINALVIILLSVQLCLADDSGVDGYEQNPILEKQPIFARSLPVQILLNGIVFALTAVLLIHLLFTAQYHWPLAPLNYVLQLAGVVSLLISVIATLCVILAQAFRDSQEWPYMLTYLAVDVPPTPANSSSGYEPAAWTTAELAAWYTMDATTSALVQITHIQFLTLLYPSGLEQRLILCLLGPLAVLSAAMELLPVQQSQTVVDVASTIRNTCNAALSLLFTAALFLWGFLVNRKQAWRTDGGTAAFGGAALTLAFISSALNFLYIPTKDQYTWLPQLIWVVVLWQSFLGWWWWVGGGRGVGEVEELLRREERRDRKRKARAARRSVRREKAQALWRNASETLGFVRKTGSIVSAVADHPNSSSIEMTTRGVRPDAAVSGSNSSTTSSPAATTTANGSGVYTRLRTSPPLLALSHFYHLLRRAHLTAAHSQALERMRRRRAAYGDEAPDTTVVDSEVVGWGLGSFGLRERERREAELVGEQDREVLVQDDAVTTSAEEQQDVRSAPSLISSQHQVQSEIREGRKTRPEPPPRRETWSLWWWGPLRRWRLQDSTAY